MFLCAICLIGFTDKMAHAPVGELISNAKDKRIVYIACVKKIKPKSVDPWSVMMKRCDEVAEYKSKQWKPL